MYLHTGQYDHTLSAEQLYQVTHALYPEDVTPKISLWLQLKHSNLQFYCCVSWEETDRKNIQLHQTIQNVLKMSSKGPQSPQKGIKVLKRASKSSTGPQGPQKDFKKSSKYSEAPQNVHSYTCIHSESRCKWKGKVFHFHFF